MPTTLATWDDGRMNFGWLSGGEGSEEEDSNGQLALLYGIGDIRGQAGNRHKS